MFQVYKNRYALDCNKFGVFPTEAEAAFWANKFVGGHYVKI